MSHTHTIRHTHTHSHVHHMNHYQGNNNTTLSLHQIPAHGHSFSGNTFQQASIKGENPYVNDVALFANAVNHAMGFAIFPMP